MPVFGVIGSEAEIGSLPPVNGAGSIALSAAIPLADGANDC